MTDFRIKWWAISIFFLGILLFACEAEQTVDEAEVGPYFSLKDYFENEIERLTQSGQTLRKSITLDGKLETQELEKVDFSAELELFLKADINRPAWTDKYQIDSTLGGGKLQALRYTALDTLLPTQQIHISFATQADSQRVTRVAIISHAKTALSNSSKELAYDPRKGYIVRATQGGTMTDELKLQLDAQFIRLD